MIPSLCSRKMFSPPESAGLIGSLTLGRYVLALDYTRGQFALDPRP